TLAAIAGAKLPEDEQKQFDGRDLTGVLSNDKAEWPERYLFTHIGRWDKGQAENAKYRNCAVRFEQYTLVRAQGPKEAIKPWELYDLKSDPGEAKDLAAQKPDVVKKLDAAYDAWWASVLPLMVNENAPGPKEMPYKLAFEKQFPK